MTEVNLYLSKINYWDSDITEQQAAALGSVKMQGRIIFNSMDDVPCDAPAWNYIRQTINLQILGDSTSTTRSGCSTLIIQHH
jgi:hypothetical protein